MWISLKKITKICLFFSLPILMLGSAQLGFAQIRCEVNQTGDNWMQIRTLRNAIREANTRHDCLDFIDFNTGVTEVYLDRTLTISNHYPLTIGNESSSQVVTIDATGLAADECAFQVNGAAGITFTGVAVTFRNLRILVENPEKAICTADGITVARQNVEPSEASSDDPGSDGSADAGGGIPTIPGGGGFDICRLNPSAPGCATPGIPGPITGTDDGDDTADDAGLDGTDTTDDAGDDTGLDGTDATDDTGDDTGIDGDDTADDGSVDGSTDDGSDVEIPGDDSTDPTTGGPSFGVSPPPGDSPSDGSDPSVLSSDDENSEEPIGINGNARSCALSTVAGPNSEKWVLLSLLLVPMLLVGFKRKKTDA